MHPTSVDEGLMFGLFFDSVIGCRGTDQPRFARDSPLACWPSALATMTASLYHSTMRLSADLLGVAFLDRRVD
jgi:hypothetical protein